LASTAARAERFRPLSERLLPPAVPPVEGGPVAPPAYSPLVQAPDATPVAGGDPPAEAELASDVRLFRARLADVLEAHARRLLPELLRRVVGRERAAAPCDVGRLAGELVAAQAARGPVRVRVAPGDARSLRLDLPVLADPALAPGDVAIDVRDGTVDASYVARLAAFLEASAAGPG
jgi:hypothetical protein